MSYGVDGSMDHLKVKHSWSYKLEMRGRDVGELTTFVTENINVADQLHDDLKKKVLHVEQQVDIRVTGIEQWSHDFAESVNDGVNAVAGRVTHLEQWCEDIAASLEAVEGRVTNLEQWGVELAESL